MSLGILDLTDGPFLASYVMLLVATITAGIVIPKLMCQPGREQRIQDVDALAYLAGGSLRFREALVARLVAARALAVTGKRRFRVASRPPAASPAEASLLALRAPIGWRDLGDYLRPHEEMLKRRMIAAGLVIDDAEQARIRFWATLPYVALLSFGGAELMMGETRSTALLAALLITTALLAVFHWIRIDRRTRAGRATIARARAKTDRLRIAPTRPEAALAVALFGTAALAGSGWGDFRSSRRSGVGNDEDSRISGLADLVDVATEFIGNLADWVSQGGGDGAGCSGGGCGG